MATQTIRVQTSISANRKKSWDCYTKPEHITKWNFADPSWHCPKAVNDLRVGGKYCARMEAKDNSFGFDFEGVYSELTPEESFTFIGADKRKVSVQFATKSDKTEIIINFDAETENSIELQRNGWQAILDNFKKYVEGFTESAMQKLKYRIEVNATAEESYSTMLGLKNKNTYEQWTAPFNPTSTYEGSWNKGSKILFIGTDEKGKRGGMISKIAENTPHKFVSIQHLGILNGDIEIMEGPDVEIWSGGLENYLFNEGNKKTTIEVEIDVIPSHFEFFNETYPKALKKLKEIIEESKNRN